MKKIIRLTENDLHMIIKESVKKIIKEGVNSEYETTAQQQERLSKKNGKREFTKYDGKNASQYETNAQQQERLKKKKLKEANIYPGYDSSTTGEIGSDGKPQIDKPVRGEVPERERLQGIMNNIYKDMGFPNGPKGDGDNVLTSDNQLLSKKELTTAFRHYWLERAKRLPSGINLQVYEKYKNDPVGIYDWFKKIGKDYRDYLGGRESTVERIRF